MSKLISINVIIGFNYIVNINKRGEEGKQNGLIEDISGLSMKVARSRCSALLRAANRLRSANIRAPDNNTHMF